MARHTRLRSVVVPALMAAQLVGCVRTDRYHVAVLRPDDQKQCEPAPKQIDYIVKVQDHSRGDFEPVEGTRVFVQKGVPLGFERADDKLVATAGDYRFNINVPPDATVKWWAKSEHTPQFLKEIEKLPDELGPSIFVAQLIAASIATAATTNTGSCDCDCGWIDFAGSVVSSAIRGHHDHDRRHDRDHADHDHSHDHHS